MSRTNTAACMDASDESEDTNKKQPLLPFVYKRGKVWRKQCIRFVEVLMRCERTFRYSRHPPFAGEPCKGRVAR